MADRQTVGEVVRVATTIVADLGDVGGADALLFALERGYAIDQLLSLGSAGRVLGEAGLITGSGGAVEPELGSLGLIELPGGTNAMDAPVGILVAYRPPQVVAGETPDDGVRFDVESLRNRAQDLANTGSSPREASEAIEVGAVGLILVWAANGYSGEQIIEALALGGTQMFVAGDNIDPDTIGGIDYCMLLEVAGEPIIPASKPLRRPGCLDLLADRYGDSQSTTTIGSEPPENGPSSTDDATGGPGLLSGGFDSTFLAGFNSSVEVNSVLVDLTGDVPVFTVALRSTLSPDLYDNDPDVLCQPRRRSGWTTEVGLPGQRRLVRDFDGAGRDLRWEL